MDMAGGVLCLLQLIPMLSVILYTERMLKRTFDSEGNRISHTNPNSIT